MRKLVGVEDLEKEAKPREEQGAGVEAVKSTVLSFLAEDVGFGDITSELLIDQAVHAEAYAVCKERAVAAGLTEAVVLFEALGCRAECLVDEGSEVEPGTRLLRVEGGARAILMGERTALNIIMRMSGVATETRRMVERARRVDPRVRVACTRKTAPGLRVMDKRAVMLGGGDTHRLRLDDCVLIKDNHIKVVGSVSRAVRTAKEKASFTKKVEVEVASLEDAVAAAEAKADILMLDHIRPEEIREIVSALEKMGIRDRLILEASGNITYENIEEYTASGVDVLSTGAVTHSAKAVDVSLKVERSYRV